MIRTSLLLGVLLAGTALPAAAQGTIRPGQTVRGELSSSDPVLDDNTHYDIWRFRGEAGHVYGVTLRSDAFDAYLAVGAHVAGGECDDCESDDDGGGGTDSRVEFRASGTGTYEIRANSLMEGETGAYTVELEDLGERAQQDESDAAIPIRIGATVQGELTNEDSQAEDDSYYDLYIFQGRGGETVTVTLSSDAFDAFLAVGRIVDGEFEALESNDDGPDGTDSELSVTLPDDGNYVIRANSLMGGETGAYTLRLTRD